MSKTGYGYCQCGCGQKTRLAPQTDRQRGWVKGEPVRFLRGHASRRQTPRQTCSFDGCERDVLARGMCATHYQREAKARNPEKFNEYRERWNERHPGRAREQGRARYKRNPEAHITYSRRSIVKKKYGLALKEYEAIIARGCAICGSHAGRLALDHCHATGNVRDCLCTNCNNGLGRFADDPARLRAAADYLEKHRTEVAA